MVKRCDVDQGPEDITWLFSLATNYDTSIGVSLYEPLEEYCEIVGEAFGSSQKVVWWLEYTVNHDPGHWWVSEQRSAVMLSTRGVLIAPCVLQWYAHRPEWIDGWDLGWVYRFEGEG